MEQTGGRHDTVPVYGPKLKALRRKAGLTQLGLASRVGVSRGYIAVMEGQADTPVRRVVVERLAEALGTTIPDLAPPSEDQPISLPQAPSVAQRRRGLRLGSGFPSNPINPRASRAARLRDVLQQLKESTAIVEELLREEEANE